MSPFNFLYSIPYLCIFSALIMLSFIQLSVPLTKRANLSFVVFGYSLLIFFFGFRGFLLTDFQIYYPFFHTISINNYKEYLFEPGFSLYVLLIKNIWPNYHFFVFVSFFIDVILLNVFLNRYVEKRYHLISLVFYFAFFGMVLEIDLMRNVKSLMLFLISLKFLEERKLGKYLLLNLIGLLFHWTSLFFLPLYFILIHKISLKTILLVLFLGHFIFIFEIGFIKPIILFIGDSIGGTIDEKLTFYVNNEIYGQTSVISFGYLERLISSLIVLLLYGDLTKDKKNLIFVNTFLIFILLTLYFFEVRIVLTRFCALFAFSYSVLWDKVFNIIQKQIRPLFIFCIVVILLLKIYSQTNTLFMRYDNVLIGTMLPYEQRLEIVRKYSSIIID